MTIEALPLITRALATASPRAASTPVTARALVAAPPAPSRSLAPRAPLASPSPGLAPRPKRATATSPALPALALASEIAPPNVTSAGGGGVAFDLSERTNPVPRSAGGDGGEGSSVGVSVEAPDLIWYALGAALLAWGAWEVYRRRSK